LSSHGTYYGLDTVTGCGCDIGLPLFGRLLGLLTIVTRRFIFILEVIFTFFKTVLFTELTSLVGLSKGCTDAANIGLVVVFTQHEWLMLHYLTLPTRLGTAWPFRLLSGVLLAAFGFGLT